MMNSPRVGEAALSPRGAPCLVAHGQNCCCCCCRCLLAWLVLRPHICRGLYNSLCLWWFVCIVGVVVCWHGWCNSLASGLLRIMVCVCGSFYIAGVVIVCWLSWCTCLTSGVVCIMVCVCGALVFECYSYLKTVTIVQRDGPRRVTLPAGFSYMLQKSIRKIQAKR